MLINPIDPVEIKEIKFQTKDGIEIPQASMPLPNNLGETSILLNREIDFSALNKNKESVEKMIKNIFPQDINKEYFEGRKPLLKSKLKVESGLFKSKIQFDDTQSLIFKDQSIASRAILLSEDMSLEEIKLIILLKKGEEFKQASIVIKPKPYSDPNGPNDEIIIKYLKENKPPWINIGDVKINKREIEGSEMFLNVSITMEMLEDLYLLESTHNPKGLPFGEIGKEYIFVREASKKGKVKKTDTFLKITSKEFKWELPDSNKNDYDTTKYKSSPKDFSQEGKEVLIIDSDEYKEIVSEKLKIISEKEAKSKEILSSVAKSIKENCDKGFYLGKFKFGENNEYFSLKLNKDEEEQKEFSGSIHFSSSFATKSVTSRSKASYLHSPKISIFEKELLNQPRRKTNTNTSYVLTVGENGIEESIWVYGYSKSGPLELKYITSDEAINKIKLSMSDISGKMVQGRRIHEPVMKVNFDGLKATGTVTFPGMNNVIKSIEGEIKLTDYGLLLQLKEIKKISEDKSSAYVGIEYFMSLDFNGDLGGIWNYGREKGQLLMIIKK